MRRLPSIVAFLLLLPIVVPSSGCFVAAAAVVGAAAAGAVSYDNNEAWMDVKDTLQVTWAATVRAMRKLGYPLAGDPQCGGTEGRIEIDKTSVVVEALPGGYVRVHARVGTFDTADNERRAKLILEETMKQLPPVK